MAATENNNGRSTPRARTVRIELPFRTVVALVGVGVGIFALLWIFAKVWQTFLILTIALVLAGTFSPIVDRMERRGVTRAVAIVIVLVGLILAVVGLGFLVIPSLVRQIHALITNAPRLQQRLADYMAKQPALADRADDVRNAKINQFLAPFSGSAFSIAQSTFEMVLYAFTTIALAFYLIADRERVRGFFFALIPRRYHVRTARLLLAMETIVGGYMRGQALTSALIGVFTFALLLIVRVPNPLVLAILAAFTDLIPFIGAILAITPAVLSALTNGVAPAVIVLVAMVLYQEFESRVIIPRVYGKTLRMSPVAVTVALLVGGELLGIAGALLALPIAAGIRAAIEQLRIELPGDQIGEEAQRALDAEVEILYAKASADEPAEEAATLATALADELNEEQEKETGSADVPIEKQRV